MTTLRQLRLLDLFCGAGGCSVGYRRAGFEVVGVDINPQRHYPCAFIQGDAIDVLRRMLLGEKFLASDGRWYGIDDFDAIHASPPCQAYSRTRNLKTTRSDHVDLIPATRMALIATGRPYVIENVPGAPLSNPLMLCGSMFGLGVLRHRLFECSPAIWFPPTQCNHVGRVLPMWWKSRREALERGEKFAYVTVAGKSYLMTEAKKAMGIDWMIRSELSQAIPPAYTEWIGAQLLAHLAATT